MRVAEVKGYDGALIRAYGPGHIQVGDIVYHRSLIITRQHVLADWPPTSAATLTQDHLARVAALTPEIVLLGTGSTQIFPDPKLYANLLTQRIGLEIMDTRAACRTYNILLAEDRQVVAALIMI